MFVSGLVLPGPITAVALGKIVNLRKRNSSGFAIDGGNNGRNGQNVYLWTFGSNNDNQKFVEINRGGGFFSYQKFKTSYSLDGGNGGSNRQNLYLWTTGSSNRNQQWQKQSTGGGSFKLIKRNAAVAIDGGSGGRRSQNVQLYDSSNSSQNLQWIVTEN